MTISSIAGTEDKRASKRLASKERVSYTQFGHTPRVNTTFNTPKAKKNLFTSPPLNLFVPLTIDTPIPPIKSEEFKMADRLLRDYRPTVDGVASSIQPPVEGARNLSISPHMINMIQGINYTFSGEP
ncbi:hypothetical protein LINPERPRIM_LOCUS21733, partial [Linum perenne]